MIGKSVNAGPVKPVEKCVFSKHSSKNRQFSPSSSHLNFGRIVKNVVAGDGTISLKTGSGRQNFGRAKRVVGCPVGT